MISTELRQTLIDIVGPKAVAESPNDAAPYLIDARGYVESTCDLVLRPATTGEVAAIVRACRAAQTPIVPRGGGTGLVGGSVIKDGVMVSLDRMNQIEDIDALNMTMTVQAGAILQTIQQSADEAQCYFPLSLGAEGSCQIGGNIATNAGGVGVLRYGNTRELVLGLEVVLPDGEIWDGLNALRKNNTGYDLKQLFIGSEGTLGIVTRAVLKLFPKPRSQATTFVAMESLDAVLPLFDRIRAGIGDRVTAFELIPRLALDLCTAHIPGLVDPFDAPHGQYALIEVASPRDGDTLREDLETVLAECFESDLISDAVFADNETQRATLWRMRETIPEAQTLEGASIKHDVSVPVSKSTEFIQTANQLIGNLLPGTRFCAFGHIGDGNIHYNLTQPVDMEAAAFMSHADAFHRTVHDLVAEMGGSISAEHGIGTFKLEELARYKSATELEMMRRIKQALDPAVLLNPGKIFNVD